MREKLLLLFTLIPELAVFVFVAVCTVMVFVKGGRPASLTPMLLVLAANTCGIWAVLRRRK